MGHMSVLISWCSWTLRLRSRGSIVNWMCRDWTRRNWRVMRSFRRLWHRTIHIRRTRLFFLWHVTVLIRMAHLCSWFPFFRPRLLQAMTDDLEGWSGFGSGLEALRHEFRENERSKIRNLQSQRWYSLLLLLLRLSRILPESLPVRLELDPGQDMAPVWWRFPASVRMKPTNNTHNNTPNAQLSEYLEKFRKICKIPYWE